MTEFENLLQQAPAACTLPTADRPLRAAEFTELFAAVVDSVERRDLTTAIFTLPLDALESARDLAARETDCCSFFEFAVEPHGGHARMTVRVPARYADVLHALTGLAGEAR